MALAPSGAGAFFVAVPRVNASMVAIPFSSLTHRENRTPDHGTEEAERKRQRLQVPPHRELAPGNTDIDDAQYLFGAERKSSDGDNGDEHCGFAAEQVRCHVRECLLHWHWFSLRLCLLVEGAVDESTSRPPDFFV
jgi:hypothetical protein